MAKRTHPKNEARRERVEVIVVKGNYVRRIAVNDGAAYIYDPMIPLNPSLDWITDEPVARKRKLVKPKRANAEEIESGSDEAGAQRTRLPRL